MKFLRSILIFVIAAGIIYGARSVMDKTTNQAYKLATEIVETVNAEETPFTYTEENMGEKVILDFDGNKYKVTYANEEESVELASADKGSEDAQKAIDYMNEELELMKSGFSANIDSEVTHEDGKYVASGTDTTGKPYKTTVTEDGKTIVDSYTTQSFTIELK